MNKTLNDTFIFNHYDKELKNKIIQFVTTSNEVSYDELSMLMYEIEKRFSFSLKSAIVTDFKSGKITPIYNDSMTLRVPAAIPSILTMQGGKVKCFVNLNNYATKDKEGNIQIDVKKLFVLLQSGTIYTKTYENFLKLQRSSAIIEMGSELYSKMFVNILNKKFALNIDDNKHSQVTFLAAKFFMINLLGKEPSTELDNYALKHCKINSPYVINDVNKSFDVDNYKSLELFINALSKTVRGLEKLNVRGYLDSFATTYGPSTLFALEFLPFFFHVCFSIIVGAFINNQYILENMFGNTVDKLYNNFTNITSGN